MAKVAVNPKARFYAVPIFVVGTYDAHGTPNAAVVAWGGTTSFSPPRLAIYLRRTSATAENIRARGAFTVCIPTVDFAPQVDLLGTCSGREVDKFGLTGLTPERAQTVDAPGVAEFPVVAECRLVATTETGRHLRFEADVVTIRADDSCLGENGLPDFGRVRPLLFAPEDNRYHGLSRPVAQAFSVGREFREAPGRLFRPSRAKKLDDEERLAILSIETLAALLAMTGVESLVDLGSGTGFYTNRLAQLTKGIVYAVEMQPEMLERHVERGVPANVRLVLADLRRLPLPEASVDRALSIYAYHEAPGGIGLERVARALKPGGRLVIVDWKRSHEALEHGPPLEIRATWQEVAEAMTPYFSQVEGRDLDRFLFVATGVK